MHYRHLFLIWHLNTQSPRKTGETGNERQPSADSVGFCCWLWLHLFGKQ